MPPTGKTSNAFAALREESAVLKQKEKKERALARKAARQEAEVVPVAVISNVLKEGVSWADVDDDDDEDEIPAAKEGEDNLQDFLSESEDEKKSSDEEQEEEEEAPTTGNDQTRFFDRIKEKKKVEKPELPQQSGKQLSKKEKTKQELADLEDLLNDLGLKSEDVDSVKLESRGKSSSSDAANPATLLANSSKSKKKKKKSVSEPVEATDVPDEMKSGEQEPGVSRDEALAKLKAAAKKKKKPGSNTVVSAVVLEEAKKKSEAKKAKQKKDKDRLMFRPV